MKLLLSDRALIDVQLCLDWSATVFGVDAARRYAELINVAIEDLVANPNPAEAEGHPELFPIKLYHLRHSRKRAPVEGLIVKSPRHFIAYRVLEDDALEVLRILHDSMNIEEHLLEEGS
ncbi:MAG: type II toxin-antitoxin system RelE/ParE family toxin [Verrucomicrobium sp.]|nr:type II toxin-antitoxin system RelE/ParE family toxin [Verrucomicrobium sp.]